MPALEKQLVLHRFMCGQFGGEGLYPLVKALNDADDDGFYRALLNRETTLCENLREQLPAYDENIDAISRRLKITDDHGRTWKPFQYLALMFTEHYLELYFSDIDGLLAKLNECNAQHFAARDIPEYTADDLRKLAFQSATGSGKTLLLHANILQYRRCLEKHNRLRELNKVILVTPDEGLSNQHIAAFAASGIAAQHFSDDDFTADLSGNNVVDVIDLHKLAEKKGVKRVALEAFEDNNLILVDEGHLGMGGNKWRDYRKQLAENGFTFEYSATFNQAVAGNGAGIAKLRREYGKAILFDYSYKFFYNDGYGKDYHITNLREDGDADTANLYLLACLLMFYQQCRVFRDNRGAWSEYNIAPPLWVFLGRTVIGQTANGDHTKSDVVSIVRFLAWVQNNKPAVTAGIRQLIDGDAELLDENNAELFANRFDQIKHSSPATIYNDLRDIIFRGRGRLRIAHLTGEDELQLRVGDCAPFGVINVGDAAGLYALLRNHSDEFQTYKDAFSKPLFAEVDNDHSPVNVVIGARKFVAGWNSWRVSTMGLMHVGTGEGPQIIQMFGRGVRLKGRGMSLKRHDKIMQAPSARNEKLKVLETLNVFGVRANYMERFRQYLGQQGIPKRVDFSVRTTPHPPGDGWQMIKKRDDVGEYRFSAERPALPETTETRIELNRYPHLQTLAAGDAQVAGSARNIGLFCKTQLACMNNLTIYHKVLDRKHRNGWHNMTISRDTVDRLLEKNDWYTLYIPPEKMEWTSYRRVREWEALAVDLICEYAKRFWRKQQRGWEQSNLEVAPLQSDHPGFVAEYKLSVDKNETELIDAVKEFVDAVAANDYAITNAVVPQQLSLLTDAIHAYIPLLHATPQNKIQVSPVALNDGEKNFAVWLAKLTQDQNSLLAGKETYLMRNLSRGKGVSFFNAHSFYPDFILWIKQGDRQDVLFIDPKGLQRYDYKTHDKVKLHKRIKETQAKMQANHPRLHLHSYIWSTTPADQIGADQLRSEASYRRKGVYFAQYQKDEIERLLQHALTNP